MNPRTATLIPQSRERGSATVELLVVAIALLAFTGGLIGVGRLASVVLDPATGQPAEQDPNESFRERRSFKFLDGAWKVVEVIEETGP